jgi:hypothetical protein
MYMSIHEGYSNTLQPEPRPNHNHNKKSALQSHTHVKCGLVHLTQDIALMLALVLNLTHTLSTWAHLHPFHTYVCCIMCLLPLVLDATWGYAYCTHLIALQGYHSSVPIPYCPPHLSPTIASCSFSIAIVSQLIYGHYCMGNGVEGQSLTQSGSLVRVMRF